MSYPSLAALIHRQLYFFVVWTDLSYINVILIWAVSKKSPKKNRKAFWFSTLCNFRLQQLFLGLDFCLVFGCQFKWFLVFRPFISILKWKTICTYLFFLFKNCTHLFGNNIMYYIYVWPKDTHFKCLPFHWCENLL